MTNRYETLNVSLQTDNRNSSRLIKTIDVEQPDNDSDHDQTEHDERYHHLFIFRVNKFKELYYKNEKLRR